MSYSQGPSVYQRLLCGSQMNAFGSLMGVATSTLLPVFDGMTPTEAGGPIETDTRMHCRFSNMQFDYESDCWVGGRCMHIPHVPVARNIVSVYTTHGAVIYRSLAR